jgi:choice-of-anchor C domain-containing protein
MKKFVIIGAVLGTLPFSASAQNLIANGGFETFSWSSISSPADTVVAGSSAISGWVVGGNSVDVVRNNPLYGPISGNSIDMFGTPGPGSLSQSFATVIGQQYLLQFDLGYNAGGGNPIVQNDTFSINVSLNGGPATNWLGTHPSASHYTESFTATTGLTTLKFSSPNYVDYSGATLDNVSVSAVPEPETYAMLLSGLGIIGFIGRRRKAVAEKLCK